MERPESVCLKNTFVLLHQFRKKTQKTPKREIERAKAERDDYLARKENWYIRFITLCMSNFNIPGKVYQLRYIKVILCKFYF